MSVWLQQVSGRYPVRYFCVRADNLSVWISQHLSIGHRGGLHSARACSMVRFCTDRKNASLASAFAPVVLMIDSRSGWWLLISRSLRCHNVSRKSPCGRRSNFPAVPRLQVGHASTRFHTSSRSRSTPRLISMRSGYSRPGPPGSGTYWISRPHHRIEEPANEVARAQPTRGSPCLS
jgi:hypothetical protein